MSNAIRISERLREETWQQPSEKNDAAKFMHEICAVLMNFGAVLNRPTFPTEV